MKATEQEFPVVLFVILHMRVLTLEFMKATEQCFPVVLLIMLYKVVLTSI